MTKVYVFQCNADSEIFGFSLKESADILPLKHCSHGWTFSKAVDISEDTEPLHGASGNDILNGIELHGYYVTGVGIEFREIIG